MTCPVLYILLNFMLRLSKILLLSNVQTQRNLIYYLLFRVQVCFIWSPVSGITPSVPPLVAITSREIEEKADWMWGRKCANMTACGVNCEQYVWMRKVMCKEKNDSEFMRDWEGMWLRAVVWMREFDWDGSSTKLSVSAFLIMKKKDFKGTTRLPDHGWLTGSDSVKTAFKVSLHHCQQCWISTTAVHRGCSWRCCGWGALGSRSGTSSGGFTFNEDWDFISCRVASSWLHARGHQVSSACLAHLWEKDTCWLCCESLLLLRETRIISNKEELFFEALYFHFHSHLIMLFNFDIIIFLFFDIWS